MASTTAVSARGSSLISGASSDERETWRNPAARSASPTARSCAGLRYACISATAAASNPSAAQRDAAPASVAGSSGRSTEPLAVSRSSTSTTHAYSGSRVATRSANRSGRCCVPIRSRSPKPRVMNSATRPPRRSSSALVPRVVASRMASGGSRPPKGVRVTSLAARIGASSGEASSMVVPAGGRSGSGRSR